MQQSFGFGLSDVGIWYAALGCRDAPRPVRRRTALGQLVKSMLSGRTRQVSASTLNAGMLALPVMIVDTHVLRRLGFVPANATLRNASEAVTAAVPGWTGDDYLLFHIALKRLGQTICRGDVPDCAHCRLGDDCSTARLQTVPGWTRKLTARMG